MSEKIKAIRGTKGRGKEVREWLKEVGAVVITAYDYDSPDFVYVVDPNNGVVDRFDDEVSYLFDIVELPVKKPLLQVILGNKERSEEVIQALEDMGGINTNNITGDAFHCYYYLNSAKCICHKSKDGPFFDNYVLEVLILPKNYVKPTLKVIRGVMSRPNGSEIITTLMNMGGYNTFNYSGDASYESCYYLDEDNNIRCDSLNNLNKKYELEFIKLPEKNKYEFKPFDKVLVRNENTSPWNCDFFSLIRSDDNCPYHCVASNWIQCIPFEGNEDKVGKVTD